MCDGKSKFSAAVQCHMIFHKSFLYADLVLRKKYILIVINVENSCSANISEKMKPILSSKEHLFEIEFVKE